MHKLCKREICMYKIIISAFNQTNAKKCVKWYQKEYSLYTLIFKNHFHRHILNFSDFLFIWLQYFRYGKLCLDLETTTNHFSPAYVTRFKEFKVSIQHYAASVTFIIFNSILGEKLKVLNKGLYNVQSLS